MSDHHEDAHYEVEEELPVELFRQSLFNLGKTFNNARHAYLSLNLAQQQITHINVSHNYLKLAVREFKSTFTCK